MALLAVHSACLQNLQIVAEAHDGASVMSSQENGVQREIRDVYPTAIYVHCMAHKLNLVIVRACTTN